MPLLHRKKYELSEPPPDLDSDEEVFCCENTCEIFRDYEEFYKKTILYNSLVWTCSITDRPNMTYQEAVQCERSAYKKLKKVPKSLQQPILFLVTLVKRTKIDHLNDLVYNMIKDRYFVGENVEVTVGKLRRCDCTILSLNAPKASNGHAKNNKDVDSDDSDIPLAESVPVNPSKIEYSVRYGQDEKAEKKIVTASAIRRLHGVMNRAMCRLLLKANCYKPTGSYIEAYQVKETVMQNYDLENCKWNDFFAGPQKHFTADVPKGKAKKAAKPNSVQLNQDLDSDDDDVDLQTALKNLKNRKKKGGPTKKETAEGEKRRLKEEKKKKADDLEKERQQQKVEKERKRLEREQELMTLKKEKALLRQQKAEEKKAILEKQREWARPREDLQCDDLKELPEPEPIDLPIPADCFGDVIALLEFFQVFGKHFGLKQHIPHRIDCALVFESLLAFDHNSPLCEFFFFFLTHLMSSENADPEGYEKINVETGDRELAAALGEKVTEEALMAASTLAATWPKTYQGYSLSELELDSYTVTEILRLYLISSARRIRSETKLWRFQQLGAYSFYDDTPLKLCLDRPELINKLSKCSVYDLEVEEKLTLLICLMHQFLSNSTSRDLLDDNYDHLMQAKTNLREGGFAEKRRQREAVNERTKLKTDWRAARLNNQSATVTGEAEPSTTTDGEKSTSEEKSAATTNVETPMEVDIKTEATVNKDDREKLIEALEAFDEEEIRLKESWEDENKKHQMEIAKYQCFFRTAAIGKDRYYRRYWTLNWCPAVLVEEYEDEELTQELLAPAPNPAISIDKKETSSLTKIGGGEADTSSPPSPSQSSPKSPLLQGKRPKWFMYRNVEDLEELIASLNCRGFRESKLLENLKNMKHEIVRRLDGGKRSKINLDDIWSTPPPPKKGRSVYEQPAEKCSIIEYLREHILDFENRLYQGSLGIVKVHNRKLWRDMILAGNRSGHKSQVKESEIPEPASTMAAFRYSGPIVTGFVENEDDDSDVDAPVDVVNDLAKSLLAIERGINRKYLKSPFGAGHPQRANSDEIPDDNKVKQANNQLSRWEASLLKCTSVSQIFLHLTSLERSVLWSRATTNAKCRLCRRKGDAETMLLCDSCDRGHHMECLEPPLKHVPSGDWYCPLCKPKMKNVKTKKTKTKKQVKEEVVEAEEEDEEEEEEEEEEMEVEEEEESEASSTTSSARDGNRPSRKRGMTYKMAKKIAEDIAAAAGSKRKSRGENGVASRKGHKRSATEPAGKSVAAMKKSRKSEQQTTTPARGSGRKSAVVATTTAKNSTKKSTSSRKSDVLPTTNGSRSRKSSTSTITDEDSSTSSQKRLSRRQLMSKELNVCREMINELTKHVDSWPFLQPVDKNVVEDYYSIITNPMDFSTIRKKFSRSEYLDPSAVMADTQLIFDNCLYYNEKNSEVGKAAISLQKQFKKLITAKSMEIYAPATATKNSRKSR